MKPLNFRQRYGYPLWIVLVMLALFIAVPGSIIAAFTTGDWEWLGLTALLALIVWGSTRA